MSEERSTAEIRKWRDDAIEVSAAIVARYVDYAGAGEAEGAIDDILALHSDPKSARASLAKTRAGALSPNP